MKTIPPPLISRAFRALSATAAFLALLILASALPSVRGDGSPPNQMSYQGFLVDGDGNPLAPSAPANFQVVFRIYDEEQGGTPLWSEQQIVTVDKGNFSVVLGEGTEVAGEQRRALSSVFMGASASSRYLGLTVTIGANSLTLLPRLRLLPAPYSFLASQAAQLVDPSSGLPFVTLNGSYTRIPGNASFGGNIFWGSASGLTSSHGGSMELGDSLTTGATPYIDFHYGTGAFQDWNMRLINDADGRLSLHGGTLSLGASLADTKLALWDNGTTTYGLGVQGSQFRLHVPTSTARFSFLNGPAGGEVLSVLGNGRVGIGTASPGAPLDVRGSVGSSHNFAFYARGQNIFGTPIANTGTSSGAASYSILAAARIGALEFNAFSDARIKEVVGQSDGPKDLEIIRHLRVKDYYAVDKIADGDSLKKGFIAQEVKELIPAAVTVSKRFIPDIYALPEAVDYDSVKQELTLTLAKAHQVKAGDQVQIFAAESRLERPVLRVLSSKRFVVGDWECKPAEVFVYGKEVSDFHILNYDHIFTTGISAIQELHKMVEARDARIASMERELAGLKKQMAGNSKANAEWQARFAALERIVARVADQNDENNRTVALREAR